MLCVLKLAPHSPELGIVQQQLPANKFLAHAFDLKNVAGKHFTMF